MNNGKNLELAKIIYCAINEIKMPWRKTWHNGAETRPYNLHNQYIFPIFYSAYFLQNEL